MASLHIPFFLVFGIGVAFGAYILVAKPGAGNATLAACLAGLFAGFTAIQIWQEGVVMFFNNQTVNLTGLQVWWDLIMCVIIAFFFIAPRAREVGMNLLPWAIFAGLTASIGLLAMCARLFWLERLAKAQSS